MLARALHLLSGACSDTLHCIHHMTLTPSALAWPSALACWSWTGSCCVVQDCLEFLCIPDWPLNLRQSPCPSLLSAGITDIHHDIVPFQHLLSSLSLCPCFQGVYHLLTNRMVSLVIDCFPLPSVSMSVLQEQR